MANDWNRQILISARLTGAVYLSSLMVATAVLFLFPPGETKLDAEWKLYFHEILILAGLTLILARWWGIQLFSKNSLAIRYRVNGLDGVLTGLRMAALTGALLADFCVLMGVFFYIFTRNPNHLFAMIGFWGVHLALGTASLSHGRREVAKLVATPEPLRKVA